MSILPFCAGVAIFVGGWQGFLWAWPSIVFLAFMIPLPGSIQSLFSYHLQSVATHLSVFVIQTLGIPAVAEGHTIRLTEEHLLNVAEACSGLRMMMLFFALCVGAAFVVRRPLWEKIVIILSAAPIAVIANATRIIFTAILYQIGIQWPSVLDLSEWGGTIHDWAGYVVEMPTGMLLLWAETALLSKLMLPSVDRPLVSSSLLPDVGSATMTGQVLPRKRK